MKKLLPVISLILFLHYFSGMESQVEAQKKGDLQSSGKQTVTANPPLPSNPSSVGAKGGDVKGLPGSAPAHAGTPPSTPIAPPAAMVMKSDLSIRSLAVKPEKVTQGDTVTVKATIYYQGTAELPIRVRFLLNQKPLGSDQVIRVVANAEGWAGLLFKADTQGNHEVTVLVDPNNEISENNEGNNKARMMIQVVAPAPPMERAALKTDQGKVPPAALQPQPAFPIPVAKGTQPPASPKVQTALPSAASRTEEKGKESKAVPVGPAAGASAVIAPPPVPVEAKLGPASEAVRELSRKDLNAVAAKLEQFINSHGGLGGVQSIPGPSGQSNIPDLMNNGGSRLGTDPQSARQSLESRLQTGQGGNLAPFPSGPTIPSGPGPADPGGYKSPRERFEGNLSGYSGGSSQRSINSSGTGAGSVPKNDRRSWVANEPTANTNAPTSQPASENNSSGETKESFTTTLSETDKTPVTITVVYNSIGDIRGFDIDYINKKGNKVHVEYSPSGHIYQGTVEIKTKNDPKPIIYNVETGLPDLVPLGPKASETQKKNKKHTKVKTTERSAPDHQPPPPWVIEAAQKLLADIQAGRVHPTADSNVINPNPEGEGSGRAIMDWQKGGPPKPDQPAPDGGPGGGGHVGPSPDEIRDPFGLRHGEDIDPVPPGDETNE